MKMQSSTAQTASEYFGSMVESYDSLIRRAVPRYDEMIARLLDYLPPAAANILELGCGTGNLSLKLAEKYPQAALTFVDASPEMLAITRARLEAVDAPAVSRASFVEETFENIGSAPASFNLVVSSISLHHVEDKAALYERIYAALRDGGALRFADQLRGATEAIHDVN